MKLPFKTLWPGGNTTAIVEVETSRKEQAALAKMIMKEDPRIEQVGFMETPVLSTSDCRLQMMGGEFCVNATRSAAYLYAKKNGLKEVAIEVSGSPNPLTVKIDGEQTITILPSDFFLKLSKKINYTTIDLKGIRHIIIEGKFDESEARGLLEEHKENYEAVGVIYTRIDGEVITIDPLIWVKETDTFVRETGCGSGSIAAAIMAHSNSNKNHPYYKVVQPSGEAYGIRIKMAGDKLEEISLDGVVRILS